MKGTKVKKKGNEMMKEKMESKNKQKGITLIALVITIVMLLILAGVTITTLTGENGILTQAGNAKTANEKGETEERINLVVNEWQIEKYKADGQNLETFLNSKVTSGEVDSVTTNANGTFTVEVNGYKVAIDENGELTIVKPGKRAKVTVKDNYTDGTKTATIPAGYTVSNIDGEKTIDDGLVIYEIPEGTTISNWNADTNSNGILDVQENYNQFVWIPATEGTYLRNTTYVYTDISGAAYTGDGYLPIRVQPDIDSSITDGRQKGALNESAERTAVLNAGGFYISRYEAGKETVNGVEKLVSKKGASVWTGISQWDSKTKAKNSNSNYGLCSGVQWDVTMAFVNGKLDGANPQQIFDVGTASSSRHIGSGVAKSGKNEADRVANIYDLEGNAWEYVAEMSGRYSNIPFVHRGGGFYRDGASAAFRAHKSGNADLVVSFRFTLYAV